MRFTMAGRLDDCLLLSYAIDPAAAARLLPRALEPITHDGRAFLNIVVSHIQSMRPVVVPRLMGLSYWHVAYRLQVRAPAVRGVPIEGLYFLRSDVDNPLIAAVGNLTTDFRFHVADVRCSADDEGWHLTVENTRGPGAAMLRVERGTGGGVPSQYSPCGLSVCGSGRRLRVAEVMRDETRWHEETVTVSATEWRYPPSVGIGEMRLVRATRVAPIDYVWRLGRSEELPSPSFDRPAGS